MLRAKITIPVQIVLSRTDYFPRHTKKDSFLSSGSRLQQRRVKTNLLPRRLPALMPHSPCPPCRKEPLAIQKSPFAVQEPVLFIAPEKHPALCCRIGSLSSPFTATATFAGSSGFSAPFFPEDIGIDEGTGGNLVVG